MRGKEEGRMSGGKRERGRRTWEGMMEKERRIRGEGRQGVRKRKGGRKEERKIRRTIGRNEGGEIST